MEGIAERLEEIHRRMRGACERSGRSAGDAALIAVSKTHGPEAIRAAWAAGQRDFGESRIQEALAKIPDAPGGVRWHFIGHLQKNKVRRALPLFDLFHSIDSVELAESVDRIAGEDGLRPRVLLEVNVSGEASKFGFSPAALESGIGQLLALPRIEIEGLMTLAPYAEDPERARPCFRALREFRDRLSRRTGLPFGTLSMGMSGDFEVAIEEGATLVRVGTAIFGSRPRPVVG
jgi:pyridoxal phosphate enzyme (YggS family)